MPCSNNSSPDVIILIKSFCQQQDILSDDKNNMDSSWALSGRTQNIKLSWEMLSNELSIIKIICLEEWIGVVAHIIRITQ